MNTVNLKLVTAWACVCVCTRKLICIDPVQACLLKCLLISCMTSLYLLVQSGHKVYKRGKIYAKLRSQRCCISVGLLQVKVAVYHKLPWSTFE